MLHKIGEVPLFFALIFPFGFFNIFLSAAFLSLLSLLSLLFFKEKKEGFTFKKVINSALKSFIASPVHLKEIFKSNKTEKISFLFSFTISFLGSVVWLIFPLMIALDELSLIEGAIAMFAFALPSAFSDLAGGQIFDRWKSRNFFFLAFFTSSLAFLYIALFGTTIHSLSFLFVASFLLASTWVFVVSISTERHKKRRGEKMGLIFASGYLGDAFGAITTGLLATISLSLPIVAAAILSTVCFAASFFLPKKLGS